jgi:hypothetical protein
MDSAHTIFLLPALEYETSSHVLLQTGVQKAYQKSILLKKDCSHSTHLHSMGHRKNVAGTFVKKIATHQQCRIKEQ